MCYVDHVGLKLPEICLSLALLPRCRSCFLFEVVLKVCDPSKENQWAVFQIQRSQLCIRLFSSADSTDHGLDWVSCREKGSTALVQGQEATSATGLLADRVTWSGMGSKSNLAD